jgi:hypothetical protein
MGRRRQFREGLRIVEEVRDVEFDGGGQALGARVSYIRPVSAW